MTHKEISFQYYTPDDFDMNAMYDCIRHKKMETENEVSFFCGFYGKLNYKKEPTILGHSRLIRMFKYTEDAEERQKNIKELYDLTENTLQTQRFILFRPDHCDFEDGYVDLKDYCVNTGV